MLSGRAHWLTVCLLLVRRNCFVHTRDTFNSKVPRTLYAIVPAKGKFKPSACCVRFTFG